MCWTILFKDVRKFNRVFSHHKFVGFLFDFRLSFRRHIKFSRIPQLECKTSTLPEMCRVIYGYSSSWCEVFQLCLKSEEERMPFCFINNAGGWLLDWRVDDFYESFVNAVFVGKTYFTYLLRCNSLFINITKLKILASCTPWVLLKWRN